MMQSLEKLLEGNSYPGRGILLGKSKDGESAVVAYFIMGRSENSRNRIFQEDGKGIRTRAHDESKMTDPSLIIYSPVRVCGNILIVTNGDQTDTVYDFIRNGDCFEEALRTRCFEPDAPNFTPRISGMIDLADGGYVLSILKADGKDQPDCVRCFYEYCVANPGEGHLIHTYSGDGDPLPSYSGEPKKVAIPNSADELAELLWKSLDNENKVSLFVRYINLSTKETESRIINKHN